MAPLSAMRSIGADFLQRLVRVTDAALRRIGGISEFETEDDGLLRIAEGHAEHDFVFRDGSHVRQGQAVIELHLWNEHLPPFPDGGPELGWTERVRQRLMVSLHRLAMRIVDNTRLQGAQALRMTISIPILGQQSLLTGLLISTGFETGELVSTMRILRFLDNIWVWLLTWTYNPRALAGWRFNRTRAEFWMSRARCVALYGDGA
ncbi:MAG: hypothetical protein WBX25_32590, partial [Rhodomicrobium sp.]